MSRTKGKLWYTWFSFLLVGKIVSDVSIRKHCFIHGLLISPRGWFLMAKLYECYSLFFWSLSLIHDAFLQVFFVEVKGRILFLGLWQPAMVLKDCHILVQ